MDRPDEWVAGRPDETCTGGVVQRHTFSKRGWFRVAHLDILVHTAGRLRRFMDFTVSPLLPAPERGSFLLLPDLPSNTV